MGKSQRAMVAASIPRWFSRIDVLDVQVQPSNKRPQEASGWALFQKTFMEI